MLLVLVQVIFVFATLLPVNVQGQEGVRDDTHVENVVRQAVADEFSSEILTNRTRAYLSCASGEMVVKLNFSEPFRGVTYTDYDRTSPCRFYGDGSRYYELRIPLKGCGTRQEAPRVFINNIIVRFHRSLELEEDEIKTIICRYPPPLAPPPSNVAPVLLPTVAAPDVVAPKLSEVELLLIICALLFLTLLLLGIGIAYYCLKKRNIKVIKKRKAISSGPGSEITKISGSTMGTLSMFDPIRIPRATALSTSGSESALLTPLSSQNGSGDHSDTIPSDYPSSVNSDGEEEGGGRRMVINDISTMRGDHFKYENTAFIPDEQSSIVSGYPEDQEKAQSVSSVPVHTLVKPTESAKKIKAKLAKENMLTTITEREDILQQREALQKTYAAIRTVPSDMHPPVVVGYTRSHKREAPPKPPSSYAPSLYGSIPDNDNRSHSEFLEDVPVASPRPLTTYPPSVQGSIPDNDIWSHSEYEATPTIKPYIRQPKRETATVTDYFINTQRASDIQEDLTRLRQMTIPRSPPPPPPPPPPPIVMADSPRSETEVIETVETKALVPRKPKITVQNIDDVYLTTTTEVHATETITKHTKDTIAQHVKSPSPQLPPPQPSPNWDVTIRHFPNQPQPIGDPVDRRWDTYSEVSEKFRDAESTITECQKRPRHPSGSTRASTPQNPPEGPRPRQTTWTSVLYKVLEPPPVEGVEQLTPEIKEKWRTVLTVDETFRSLIQEATTIEEYIRITKDVRYEKLFDIRTWHVIIRVLSTPDELCPPAQVEPSPDVRGPRYKKKNEFEPPRNRRSSLPPVSELNLAREAPPSIYGSVRSRRTSRSGSVPDYDLRSMTEVDVDFAHADRESLWSVDTGYTYKTTRSLAERSTSEFLEDVPTIVAQRNHRRDAYYVHQFVASQNAYLRDATPDDHHQGMPRSRPRFLERSSTEYFEDVPTMSLPDLRETVATSQQQESHQDSVIIGQNGGRRYRPAMERSSTEIIINSPIIRAIDLASSIGEREEIKSVTETDIFDWKR